MNRESPESGQFVTKFGWISDLLPCDPGSAMQPSALQHRVQGHAARPAESSKERRGEGVGRGAG